MNPQPGQTGASHAGTPPLPPWLSGVGQALLLIFICCRLISDKPADYAGQLLSLLAVVALVTWQHPLRRGMLVPLFFAALVTQLATWGLSHALAPDLAESSPKLERLAAWFFLIPAALFMGSGERRVVAWWSIVLLALLLTPWLSGQGWGEIARGLAGERVDFGIINAQHPAMLFGLALLGTTIFLPRFRRYSRELGVPWLLLPYLLLVLALATGVVITQTRGVWLGLLVTLPGMIVIFSGYMDTERKQRYLRALQNSRWRMRFLALLLALMIPAFFGGIVLERLASEGPLATLDGRDDTRPLLKENISVRLDTWHESLSWIAARPVFGWGGSGRGAVVDATPELSAEEKQRFGHLHSSYLDTLVNFGFAGLLVLLSLLYWLNSRVILAWRQGGISDDFLWFWLAFLLYWLVLNMFESYMYYQTGNYAFALICGGYAALTSGSATHRGRRAAASPGT